MDLESQEIDLSHLTYNRLMKLKVVITDGEDGWLIGEVPALPGCITQGKTQDELLDNVQEAVTGWLECQQDKIEKTSPDHVEIVTV